MARFLLRMRFFANTVYTVENSNWGRSGSIQNSKNINSIEIPHAGAEIGQNFSL